VTLYLVRHAKAGDRRDWSQDDTLRPLSRRGQQQARELAMRLRDVRLGRILSSPYVRCMETVVPLAALRGMAVEPADALAEGATLDAALALLRKHAHEDAVMCTHGDVMPMLLEHLYRKGVVFDAKLTWPKGCTWVLDVDTTGDVNAARYWPPPPDGAH